MTLDDQGWVSLPDGAGLQTRVFLASGFGSVMGSLPLSRQGKRQTPTPRFGLRVQAQGRRFHVLRPSSGEKSRLVSPLGENCRSGRYLFFFFWGCPAAHAACRRQPR